MSGTTFNLVCSKCGGDTKVNSFVYAQRRRSGLPYACVCGANLYETGSRPRPGKTVNQKRSQKQEKRAAKKFGGRVQAGSGSGAEKGDVREPHYSRQEHKTTSAKSYGLKLAELQKIEAECSSGETPSFHITFDGVHPAKTYVVIPEYLFEHFTNMESENG